MLEDILREEANTYGASFTKEFDFAGMYFTFNTDFFHTQFDNQLIVDMDRNSQSIYFYNLDGKSYSNSLQVDFIAEITQNLIISTAYRFNEVKMTTNGELLDKPFQSFHKGFLNAALSTSNQSWSFDVTVEYNGGAEYQIHIIIRLNTECMINSIHFLCFTEILSRELKDLKFIWVLKIY